MNTPKIKDIIDPIIIDCTQCINKYAVAMFILDITINTQASRVTIHLSYLGKQSNNKKDVTKYISAKK